MGVGVSVGVERGGGGGVEATAFARRRLTRATSSFFQACRPVLLGIVIAYLRLDAEEERVPVPFRRPWELDEPIARLGG